MSEIQGESLKMKTSILKIIDGLLCSSLPKIFEQNERNEKINNTIFNCIGNVGDNGDDDDAILNKLKETIQTTLKEHIIKTLGDKHDDYVNIVANTLIDYAKIVDEKVRKVN